MLLHGVCTRCQTQDRDFFPQRFFVEVWRCVWASRQTYTSTYALALQQACQARRAPTLEDNDQVMPETFYTKAIDHAVAWSSQTLQRIHNLFEHHLSTLDQHAAAIGSHWQQQQPWLATISLQRRSALRFRVHRVCLRRIEVPADDNASVLVPH